MKTILTSSLIVLTACASSMGASFIATDNASNYGTWGNGDNQGTGFGNWDLSDNNNNGTDTFAGYFLGDSTAGTGDINTSGNSFGIYANPGAAFATAVRGLSSTLAVGNILSIDLGVNFRNGNKGLDINDSSLTSLFNFNVGSDDYQVNGSTLGLAYQADSLFTLSFEQKAGTLVGVTVTRQTASLGTETAFSQDLDFGASIDNFKLYVSGTDNGNDANNLYFNNMAVTVPEPGVSMLLLGALTSLPLVRRR